MPLISLIVPVYNAEKYLKRCIDSILSQTFRDFELMLIDDGSTDSSGHICDVYAENDERIKVFHKKNGGVSSARNFGIENASSAWISFIDSDDYIDSNYLQAFINMIDERPDLIILSGVSYDAKNSSYKRSVDYKKIVYTDFSGIILDSMAFTSGDGCVYSKLYKLNLIKRINLSFIESNAAYEDTSFVFEYLTECKRIVIAHGSTYHYDVSVQNSLSKRMHPYYSYQQTAQKMIDVCDKKISTSNSTSQDLIFCAYSKWLLVYLYAIFAVYNGRDLPPLKDRINVIRDVSNTITSYKSKFLIQGFRNRVIAFIATSFPENKADLIFRLVFAIRNCLPRHL